MTVAEGPGITPEEAHNIVDPSAWAEYALSIEGIGIGYVFGEQKSRSNGYDLVSLKRSIQNGVMCLPAKGGDDLPAAIMISQGW
jgi:hypothetical protein